MARFRPIVLTSLMTFAGLTPLLLERSVTAQFLIPMATSLGFGVLFASAISLFLVPASYIVLEDVNGLFRCGAPEPVGALAATPEAPEPAEAEGARCHALARSNFHGAGAWGTIHRSSRAYARCGGFHIDACAPRAPQAKGKTKAKVKLSRQLVDRRRCYAGIEELQGETEGGHGSGLRG